jgi:type I restriction enzyme M protein
MASGGRARKNGNGADIGFEAELFQAADKLRGNLEPSEYKHVALGLIFLKYISDAFEAKRAELEKEDSEALEDKDEYRADPVATMREFREYFARSYESHHKIAARVGVRQSTVSD